MKQCINAVYISYPPHPRPRPRPPGTPFIDNYPTFAYIREQREDPIPSLIDRSFYAYASPWVKRAI